MALNPPRSAWDQIFRRIGPVAVSRGGVALLLADALTAIVCWFLPLADHLGFELAAALTIVNALVAPAVGASAIHAERLRSRSDRSYRAAASTAALWSGALLMVPTALMALNAIRRPSCDPSSGALWILVLPLPSAALAAATGALARSLSGGSAGTAVRVALVLVASLGLSLSSLYFGPSFFLFDHYFGYLPGPLYDEVVLFSAPLLVFRLLTLLWTWVVVLICDAIGAEWPSERFSRGAVAAILGGLLLLVSLGWGTRIGFRTTDRSLAAALGGVRTIGSLEIHYPREWSASTVESFARDAAFRASQVKQALEITRSPTIRIWVYRSADEKRRLVGAATTSFSKPWRHEVHINADATPHPVLRHELVHAFGAEIAHGIFGTPGGLFPNSPLIEGFAEALDIDSDGLTLTQWARAMRDLSIAPDVAALFTTSGFYAAAPARAYAYAGAFLRYLDGRFGRTRLLDLYATGDLSRLGKPDELVRGFNKALDAVSLTPDERATAERRFARPSVFRRRCAREVGALEDKATALLAEGRKGAAILAWEHVCALEPDDPGLLESLLRTAVQLKDTSLRDDIASKILNHPRTDPDLRAQTLMALGDDLWRQHANADATVRFSEIMQMPADPATHRSAVVKHEVALDPALSGLLEPLLADGDTDVHELFRLNDYVTAHANDRIVRYLLGRQLVAHNALARGIPLLDAASDQPLYGDAELGKETLRLLTRAQAELHRCADAEQSTARLEKAGGGAADLEVANDWVARCHFEVDRHWAPLVDIESP